ncbi:MAG: hydrogenase accessory protein [Methylocystis sp.]|uniref:hydrogenase accessory protein n=1 Tax=Methylocystis sp. TaxID=1911079 RepID=UPI003DA5B2C3
MSSQLSSLLARAGVPTVDESTAAEILGAVEAREPWLLLFAGDPVQRPEVLDVAVIFAELLKAFRGRLQGAVVAAGAEKALGKIYQVDVLPSLAVIRGGQTIGVIPRIRDWSEYIERIASLLEADVALPVKPQGPRVEITYSHKGAEA